MIASRSMVPVIGVSVPLTYPDGMDSLLSIVQMPAGVPVAAVSIGGYAMPGFSRCATLAASDAVLAARMAGFQSELAAGARAKDEALRQRSAADTPAS